MWLPWCVEGPDRNTDWPYRSMEWWCGGTVAWVTDIENVSVRIGCWLPCEMGKREKCGRSSYRRNKQGDNVRVGGGEPDDHL